MNVSLTKHTSLKPYTKSFNKCKVSDNELFGINVPQHAKDSFLLLAENNKESFQNNIQLMSGKFQSELFNQANLLLKNIKVLHKISEESNEFYGVIVDNFLSLHYKIKFEIVDDKINYEGSEIYWFSENQMVLKLQYINGEIIKYFGSNKNDYNVGKAFEFIVTKEPLHFFNRLFAVEVFKRFCNVETKIFNPILDTKKRTKKQLNQTPFKLKQLTSAYFTDLVVSGSFKVSGHWRLQPYKGGDFKLIWIKDFEKKGYTRKSKSIDINEI